MYKNKIAKIRKEKGLTQEELADLVGVSVGYISHLENGTRRNPSILVMNNFAIALQKTVTEIFFD